MNTFQFNGCLWVGSQCPGVVGYTGHHSREAGKDMKAPPSIINFSHQIPDNRILRWSEFSRGQGESPTDAAVNQLGYAFPITALPGT